MKSFYLSRFNIKKNKNLSLLRHFQKGWKKENEKKKKMNEIEAFIQLSTSHLP